jgi:hypothetical protein
MASTTPGWAIRYPNLGDPTRVAGAMADMASDVDADLTTINNSRISGDKAQYLQGKHDSVPVTAARWASKTVTFTTPYTAIPNVVASAEFSGVPYIAGVYNITTTGFTLAVGHADATTSTNTINVEWIAWGPIA